MTLYDNFINEVSSGKKLSCKWVRLSVARHIKDVKKSKKKSWPYRFDRDKADRVIKIIKLFRHTGGELAGKAFDMQPFQGFITAMIFGWVRKDNGLRRFKKVYIETAKKSGKSEYMAAIENYMLFFDNEAGAQVYTCATKRPQADHVFRPAKQMMKSLSKESKKMAAKCRVMRNEIQNIETNGFMRTLTADSDTEDGMNVSCGVADEYHAHPNDAILSNMESATVSRLQALILIITTAGFNKNGPCYQYRKNVVGKVLEGTVEAEGIFAIIFTLDEDDNWEDEGVWEKANPNIGNTPLWEPMRQRYQEAKAKGGAAIVEYKTKQLNIWVDAETQWISTEDWAACGGNWSLEDVKDRRCYGGLDLSKVEDLTAFSLLFIPTDEEFAEYYEAKAAADDQRDNNQDVTVAVPLLKFYLWTQYYCPQTKIDGITWSDGVDYRAWTEAGYITATPGNVIDYDYIERDIISAAEMLNIKFIGFDRWMSHQLVPNLIEKGVQMDPFGQGYASMTQPSKNFYTMVKNKSLVHDKNPVTAWHVSNTILTTSPAGDIKPDKSKGQNKIDGVVASIMALGEYDKDIDEYTPAAAIPLMEDEKQLYNDY